MAKGARKAQRLKILQLCTRYPPGTGGVETHVHAIATELKARGHEVEVFTSDLLTETPLKRIEPGHEEYDSVDGVSVRRFKARGLTGDAQYSFMPAMVKAVLASKADIVHAHSYGFFQTHLAMAARRMGRTRFVFTPHFHPEWASGKTQRRKFLRRVYDKVIGGSTLASADMVICVSPGEAEAIKDMGFDNATIRIIPNGIPASLLDLKPDPVPFQKEYGPGHPMVLFVGRLAENKGLVNLVEAAATVLKKIPEATFAIVGEDGGMRKAVEQRADALGISDRILLTGRIDDEGIYRSAYAACEVFVLPSIFEAFGIVVLEAMAFGRPCVATKVGGVPDLISDGMTGLIVEPNDPSGLAKALLSLLKDPEKAGAMGAKARKAVGKEFTWPRIVDRLEQVYREVLAG
jgi:glycosyltransferase involved in cell wall biosynthesis